MASPGRRNSGFTLVELMIAVAIIAILAAVAIPKYADMLKVAQEGTTKGNLGAIRSALSIYYADQQGYYPTCAVGANSSVFTVALNSIFIAGIPNVTNTLHPPINTVYCDFLILPGVAHDGSGWYYDGALPVDSQNGGVWVACDHTDTVGAIWTTY